jgi:hypothetical protein
MADKKPMSEAALGNPPTGESRGDSGKKKYGLIVDFTCLVAKQGHHLLNLPCCLLVFIIP